MDKQLSNTKFKNRTSTDFFDYYFFTFTKKATKKKWWTFLIKRLILKKSYKKSLNKIFIFEISLKA